MDVKNIAEITWIIIFIIGMLFIIGAVGLGIFVAWVWAFNTDIAFISYGKLAIASFVTGFVCVVICGSIINLFDL